MPDPGAPPVGGAFLTESLDSARMFTPERLNADAKLMARTMEEFVRKEVRPVRDRLEAHEAGLLRALVHKAGDLGLLAGTVPEFYGGLGLSRSELAIVTEKAALDSSFAITIGVHTGIALYPLLFFGTEEQKRKYLPEMATGETIGAFCLTEAGAGSDALAAWTRAILSPDGKDYVLSGTKMWITNAEIADLFTVFAKVDGEQLTAFLVEKGAPGLSLGKEEHKLGIRGSSTRRVILDECRIPAENVLGEIGKGYRPALYSLNSGRFNIGVSALGNAKECLRISAEYAQQRTQFGRPIAEFGAIRHKLGEMALRIFVLESMVYRTAGYWDALFAGIDYASSDAGEMLRAATEEYAIECAIIKFFGTETLAYVVDEGLQIHGGYGFSEEYPMARHYRDARVGRIYEGTNEINRLAVVDQLVKRELRGRLPLAEAFARMGSSVSSDDAVCVMRNAVLFATSRAWEAMSSGVDDHQEIAIAVADMCAGLYGFESAMLRAQAMKEAGAVRDLAFATGQAFGRDAAVLIADKIDTVLSAIPGDTDSWDDLSRSLSEATRVDSVKLRRALASEVLRRGGYPWGG
jgi:alkylation response protein AidB-like acyl-CoA dehydrogenase